MKKWNNNGTKNNIWVPLLSPPPKKTKQFSHFAYINVYHEPWFFFDGPILLSDPIIVESSQCSFLIYIAYSLDKTASISWLWSSFYQMSLFKSCGFGICFFCVFILRIIKKEHQISPYKSTYVIYFRNGVERSSGYLLKKQFIEKIKSLTLFKITHLHKYYTSPLSEQLKHCNRFINCVPFNFSIIRKRCRDRRQ